MGSNISGAADRWEFGTWGVVGGEDLALWDAPRGDSVRLEHGSDWALLHIMKFLGGRGRGGSLLAHNFGEGVGSLDKDSDADEGVGGVLSLDNEDGVDGWVNITWPGEDSRSRLCQEDKLSEAGDLCAREHVS